MSAWLIKVGGSTNPRSLELQQVMLHDIHPLGEGDLTYAEPDKKACHPW